ncbi:protein phosphatase 2C domain-containing protein [Luteococcus sp. OSA5]|uniref:protein phosphatase 2C domain-containing protein n=1 Tax=Luteococcus sp. OSA5 TaxID=3401630 RepID=UPI003B436DAA
MTAPSVFTRPARPDRPNEDAAATAPGIGVVVDGAGLPKDQRLGCHHSVDWYAQQLATTYRDALAHREGSMREALAESIESVARSHPECRLEEGSPSATVAAWRIDGDQLEILVLCDASILLVWHDGQVTELCDDRLGALADAAEAGLTDHGQIMRARRQLMEATRNQPGGWWCCHHDPAAAAQALVQRHSRHELRGVIAASDGVTRHHQLLGGGLVELGCWILDGRADLAHAAVREAEGRAAEQLAARAQKPHDDFTVAWQPLP